MDVPGPDSSYGERLRWVLRMRGRSQRWLADQVGVGAPRVNAWATGRTEPQARYRVPVAQALDADVGWLGTGNGAPWPEVVDPRLDPAIRRLEQKLDGLIADRGEISREDVLGLLREALARGAARRDEPGPGAQGAGRGPAS